MRFPLRCGGACLQRCAAVHELPCRFTNNIAFYQYLLDPAAVAVLQNLKIPATALLLKARHPTACAWQDVQEGVGRQHCGWRCMMTRAAGGGGQGVQHQPVVGRAVPGDGMRPGHTQALMHTAHHRVTALHALWRCELPPVQSQYPCGGPLVQQGSGGDHFSEGQLTALTAVLTVVVINSFSGEPPGPAASWCRSRCLPACYLPVGAAAFLEGLLKDRTLSFWRTNQLLYMYGMVRLPALARHCLRACLTLLSRRCGAGVELWRCGVHPCVGSCSAGRGGDVRGLQSAGADADCADGSCAHPLAPVRDLITGS